MKHAICDNCGIFYELPKGPNYPNYQYRVYCSRSCAPYAFSLRTPKVKPSSGVMKTDSGKLPREFFTWRNMVSRCHDRNHKDYVYYGARGITVCDEWRNSFAQFQRDMGTPPEGMTLDRENNDGPYCADNCRWATQRDQNRNKRSNVFLTYGNKTQLLVDWCREMGINPTLVRYRLKRGWSIARALTQQPNPKGSSPAREVAL
jgi:hypothetical protein